MEPDAECLARRRRWLAAALKGAYDLGWVPESVVANLRHIHVKDGAVVLTLITGTRLIDGQDRIDLVGRVDDVSVDEIVEAVRRRGWDAVEIEGSAGFRHAVAWRLASLDPPVTVVGSPLTETEMMGAERLRRGRVPCSAPVTDTLGMR